MQPSSSWIGNLAAKGAELSLPAAAPLAADLRKTGKPAFDRNLELN